MKTLKGLTLTFEKNCATDAPMVSLNDKRGKLIMHYHLHQADVEDGRMCFIGYDAFLEPLYAEAKKAFTKKELKKKGGKKKKKKEKVRVKIKVKKRKKK